VQPRNTNRTHCDGVAVPAWRYAEAGEHALKQHDGCVSVGVAARFNTTHRPVCKLGLGEACKYGDREGWRKMDHRDRQVKWGDERRDNGRPMV
jgi:hypothetical protein